MATIENLYLSQEKRLDKHKLKQTKYDILIMGILVFRSRTVKYPWVHRY